jgi:molybdopterin-guanine dinucleotide biosynthesis protein A
MHEPLLAHYHQFINSNLIEQFNLKNYSLQSAIRSVKHSVIEFENDIAFSSIDTPDEYENVLKQLYI